MLTSSPRLVQRTVTSDGDEFLVAAPGIEGRLVRTGRGHSDAAVTAWDVGPARVGLLEFGFPSSGGAGVLPHSIVLATILTAPPGGSWDGRSMTIGETFVYPTGSSQHAVDPAGLCLALTTITAADFDTAAIDLGYDPATAMKKVVKSPRLWSILMSLRGGLSSTGLLTEHFSAEDLVDAAVHAACGTPLPITVRDRTRRASDIELVDETIHYLDSRGQWRLPSLSLCRHLNVSERRLQLAFHRTLGVSPLVFMQQRALQSAHQRFKSEPPASLAVASVAREHGFHHLGRFAQRYALTYGEPPSATIRRGR